MSEAPVTEGVGQGVRASSSAPPTPADATGPAAFTMASGDSEDEAKSSDGTVAQYDLRPPEVPPPPDDYTPEDLNLREELLKFYHIHNPENTPKVNVVVGKFRGSSVSNLWAQLALKYNVPAVVVFELLAKTLYIDAPFEYGDVDTATALQKKVIALGGSDLSKRLQAAIDSDAKSGSLEVLRVLCYRGVPDDMRPLVWQTILGYLPISRYADWNSVKGEKRALYASYREEFLKHVDGQLSVHESGSATLVCDELLQEIRQDVDRTRPDDEFFRKPATVNALIGILFVYARLNPGVRYAQGMSDVAAILFFVMSNLGPDAAEADSFWCFTELMSEIKDGFEQDGVHAMTDRIAGLIHAYDPELALHVSDAGLPPLAWACKWCSVLFAQDLPLSDVLRLWDACFADPRRFEFTIHVAVAAVLLVREELLNTDTPFTLGELLHGAPRNADFQTLLKHSFALCSFERRTQPPQFPPPRQERDRLLEAAGKAEVIARVAAARAQEVTAGIGQRVKEQVAPVVIERATVAAAVAQDGAQVVQNMWQESAPARKEAYEMAQQGLSSLWSSVSSRAVEAVSTGQKIASDYSEGKGGYDASGSTVSFSTRASAALSAAAAAWSASPATEASPQPDAAERGANVAPTLVAASPATSASEDKARAPVQAAMTEATQGAVAKPPMQANAPSQVAVASTSPASQTSVSPPAPAQTPGDDDIDVEDDDI